MNGAIGSMEAKDIGSLQQQALNAQGGQQQDLAGAPVGADGSMQGGGSFHAAAGGSLLGGVGVDAVAQQLALQAAGGGSAVAGGSLMMGATDNGTGNVNRKLIVKRSCTEAMLKV